jgi:hypothetical protein
MNKTLIILAFGAFCQLMACQNQPTCKYKPEPIFSRDLPHVVDYNFEKEGSQSLESVMLDRGILLEVGQEVCGDTKQEFRFIVKGDFAAQPDSFWLKEASRQFVFLSTFSPKQAALKDWGDIIEMRRLEMSIGQAREVQKGVFVRVDRVISPEEAILTVVFSQK